MTPHDDGRLPERVRELAQPLAGSLGMEVAEVQIAGPDSRPLVRVIVDTADVISTTGVDVDDIATLSRQLGDRLDDFDPLTGAYTLEVTSPGADRPLRDRRDFARNLGRDVWIERHEDAAEPHELIGTLNDVDDDHLTLEVEGSEVRVAFAELAQGKVVLPW